MLIEAGADVNTVDKNGATALMKAAQIGSGKCVAILLQMGSDPFKTDANRNTPLMYAAKKERAKRNHVKCSKVLIDAGVEISGENDAGITAMMHAARSGATESLQVLIQAGADINIVD